jgi:hypothetical protein
METLEVEELPETAPKIIGFVAEAVERSIPFAPKLTFTEPPFARNCKPSASSTANGVAFAEVTSTFTSPVPVAMNLFVLFATC